MSLYIENFDGKSFLESNIKGNKKASIENGYFFLKLNHFLSL